MIKLILIRHFATEGNIQKRYIGSTDEPLCEDGKKVLDNLHYPNIDRVCSSPMIRCVETAKLIYPASISFLYEGFRECNFGDFENKNYIELCKNPIYQAWIDSNGTLPFPNGENPQEFKARCVKAFDEMINTCLESSDKSVAVVVHGGTIMSILDRYSYPHKDYYYWQVGNGSGYYAEWKESDRRLSNLCMLH